jgi:protein Tex
MKEFLSYISERWSISAPTVKEIRESFEKGDSPYYIADYVPSIGTELELSQLWDIHDFLKEAEALAPQKKRLINALKKSSKLTEQMQRRITLSMNPFELDDMLLPERPNPRSKAQLSLKKGLKEAANRIQQQAEGVSLEEIVEPFIGKEDSLKTMDDVLAGVKDILAERFAYDETARTMVREFAYDDGFFEVQPKNKKDPLFAQFSTKPVPIKLLSKENTLMLLSAEDQKTVRLKLGVNLFRMSELLKHHFIVNPDCAGFDLICQAIDDCWLRLLHPIIERDVKIRLRTEAEDWALVDITRALNEKLKEKAPDGIFLSFCLFDAKHFSLVAFNSMGRLLGASQEKRHGAGADKPAVCERLRQFCVRYKPTTIIIPDDETAAILEDVVKKSIDMRSNPVEILRRALTTSVADLSISEWMTSHFSDLDDSMRKAFALGLSSVQPFTLILQTGIKYFPLHPLQSYVSEQRCMEMIRRILTAQTLHEGISISEADSTALMMLPTLPETMVHELQSSGQKKQFLCKNDLLKVPGMTEVIFRNIAGYVIISYAEDPLDRTLVHPDHFNLITEMCQQLSISKEAVVNNPESLRSISESNMTFRMFMEKNLIRQLAIGQRFAAPVFGKNRKKLKLDELVEGTVVSGHVTNITPFGVFVNINAVCEGLIHISQLADTYIETPEQVVSVGDIINVRIIKIDPKKRRISLSMKGLSSHPIKVSPSKRQLSSLATHFQNR